MDVSLTVFVCILLFGTKSQSIDAQESHDRPPRLRTDGFIGTVPEYMECIKAGDCDPYIGPELILDTPHESGSNPHPAVILRPNAGVIPTPKPEGGNRPSIQQCQAEYLKYEDVKLCEFVLLKTKELESLHPELKILKRRALEQLNVHFAELTAECPEGESMVIKVLDLVIYLAEQLKKQFGYNVHQEPAPVPEYPKPVPEPEYIPEPAPEYPEPIEDILAEEPEYGHSGFVGSVRGIPGEHYPNYTEVPFTSFSCSDKHIPGFYADLETGCQVFHVCYEHRRESFLCPIGTLFNQPILACDYWYSSNCSLAPIYYEVNSKTEEPSEISTEEEAHIEEIITNIIEAEKPNVPYSKKPNIIKGDIVDLVKFFPIKAKVVEYPQIPAFPNEIADKIFDQAVGSSAQGVSKARNIISILSQPTSNFVLMPKVVVKPLPLAKAKVAAKVKFAAAAGIPIAKAKFAAAAAIPVAKGKLAAASIPIAKAKFAAAAAIPVAKGKFAAAAAIPVAKAKFAAAAAIPVAKGKFAAAAAIPVAKAKFAAAAAIPVTKAKFTAAGAIPIAKAKFTKAAAVPVVKTKFVAAAKVPLVKSKLLALPLSKAKVAAAVYAPVFKAKTVPVFKMAAVKSKLAIAPVKLAAAGLPLVKGKIVKGAMISPLTKKALALGYMKLLKAKKLALMG